MQGNTEETGLQRQQAGWKQAAVTPEVALDSFKVWLPGPLEAHWDHTPLGSKGPPECSTNRLLYALKSSNVFLILATKLTLTDTVNNNQRQTEAV